MVETENNHTSRHAQNASKQDPGLAHVKRPYTLTLEQEKQLLEEARRRRTILLENDVASEDFCSRVTYHGVKVSQKKDGVFCIAKGVTDVPAGLTLDDIRVQYESDFRNNGTVERLLHRIDPMNLHMTIVTELRHKQELLDPNEHEQLRVLWGAFYVGPLISDRDLCFVMHTSQTKCPTTGDVVFCTNSFSVPLDDAVPDMQDTCGRVRAELRMTGYVYRPHPTLPDRLSMAFLGQCDPKGLLPATVVNLASVSQALNAGRVRDIYVQLTTVRKELKEEVPYPFDTYHLARRGGTCTHKVPLVAPEENAKSVYVRLRAYCESSITVELENPIDGPFTLSQVNKDEIGADLVAGKPVTFGGKGNLLLDCVLQVTLEASEGEDDDTPEISLHFKNSNWSKTWLVLPVTMPTFLADPTASETNSASSSIEQ